MEDSLSKYEELKEQGRFDMPIAEECIETFEVSPGYHRLKINGIVLGVWETSQIRHFIEVLDKCAN